MNIETYKVIYALDTLKKMVKPSLPIDDALLLKYNEELFKSIKSKKISPIVREIDIGMLLHKVRISSYSLVQVLFEDDRDLENFLEAMKEILPVLDIKNELDKFIKNNNITNIEDLYTLTGIYLIASTYYHALNKDPGQKIVIKIPQNERDLIKTINSCLREVCRYYVDKATFLEAFARRKEEILKSNNIVEAVTKLSDAVNETKYGLKTYIMADVFVNTIFENVDSITRFIKNFEENFPCKDVEELVDSFAKYLKKTRNLKDREHLKINTMLLLGTYLLARVYSEALKHV